MTKCDYCEYRHSWDCDDGTPTPNGGCEDFFFDPTTLPEDKINKMVDLYILWEQGTQLINK